MANAQMQRVVANIAIAGDIKNVVYRGADRPLTLPELDILRFIHGEGSVTDVAVLDTVEVNIAEHYETLCGRYKTGNVQTVFPFVAGKPSLPTEDDDLPTVEEVQAGQKAAREAQDAARAKRGKKAAAPAEPASEPEPETKTDAPAGAPKLN